MRCHFDIFLDSSLDELLSSFQITQEKDVGSETEFGNLSPDVLTMFWVHNAQAQQRVLAQTNERAA